MVLEDHPGREAIEGVARLGYERVDLRMNQGVKEEEGAALWDQTVVSRDETSESISGIFDGPIASWMGVILVKI